MIGGTEFLAAFPEFTASPDEQIAFWIKQGYMQLNAGALGEQIDYATMLFAAHNLVLAKRSQIAVERSIPLGDAAAAIQTKTVGGVTVGYDTASAAIEGAGPWNATSYGQRLYMLMRGASLGGVYIESRRRFAGRRV